MPIYGDLYQHLQWSLTFDLKVVTHLKSASEASYDLINMATIVRNCSLIKAKVCVGYGHIYPTQTLFLKNNINYFSHMMVTSMLYLTDNELFLDNYILHAKYRRFPINTQLIGPPLD